MTFFKLKPLPWVEHNIEGNTFYIMKSSLGTFVITPYINHYLRPIKIDGYYITNTNHDFPDIYKTVDEAKEAVTKYHEDTINEIIEQEIS